jgi:hypothetical protein
MSDKKKKKRLGGGGWVSAIDWEQQYFSEKGRGKNDCYLMNVLTVLVLHVNRHTGVIYSHALLLDCLLID